MSAESMSSWKGFVQVARDAIRHDDLKLAEQNYISALQCVEQVSRADDVGLTVVLMEVAEFYADNGEPGRAEILWNKVKDHLAASFRHIARPTNLGTIGSVR
jgi:hypothetical protein